MERFSFFGTGHERNISVISFSNRVIGLRDVVH